MAKKVVTVVPVVSLKKPNAVVSSKNNPDGYKRRQLRQQGQPVAGVPHRQDTSTTPEPHGKKVVLVVPVVSLKTTTMGINQTTKTTRTT